MYAPSLSAVALTPPWTPAASAPRRTSSPDSQASSGAAGGGRLPTPHRGGLGVIGPDPMGDEQSLVYSG